VLQESVAYWNCCGLPTVPAFYDRLLPYAPFGTALIALGALVTAIVAISTQTRVARRRAAIDFFLKTDLDQNMLDAHRDFEAVVKKLKVHLTAGGTVEAFEAADEVVYRHIWKYLNVHELVAVGIKNKVFDSDVCYNFWSDVLVRHAQETKGVIDHEIKSENSPAAFLELRELSVRWNKRTQKWRDKQAKNSRPSSPAVTTAAVPRSGTPG
jgi:hypothetical protein